MSDQPYESPPDAAGEFAVDGPAPPPEPMVVPAFIGEVGPVNGMYAADGVIAEGEGILTGQRPDVHTPRPPERAGEFDVTASTDPVFDRSGAKVGERPAEYPVYGADGAIVGYTKDHAAAARLTSAIAVGDLDQEAVERAALAGPAPAEAAAPSEWAVESVELTDARPPDARITNVADDEPLFVAELPITDRLAELEQAYEGLAAAVGAELGKLNARLDQLGVPAADASAASDVQGQLDRLGQRISGLAGEVSRAVGVQINV